MKLFKIAAVGAVLVAGAAFAADRTDPNAKMPETASRTFSLRR